MGGPSRGSNQVRTSIPLHEIARGLSSFQQGQRSRKADLVGLTPLGLTAQFLIDLTETRY
jgi:hypothetical protein